MWFLKSVKNKDIVHYLLVGETYTVGSEDAWITIPNDSSISKNHAVFTLMHSENNLNNPEELATLTIKDIGSKHGTYVNKTRIIPDGILPDELKLKVGDKITFGNCESSYEVCYEPLIITTFCFQSRETTSLKEMVKKLGGCIISKWLKCCTHLVINEIKVTSKVVCAMVSLRPIVTIGYFEDLIHSIQKQMAHPDPEQYRPKLNESFFTEGNISICLNPERTTLFKNKTFICMSNEQYDRLHFIITSASGKIMLLDINQKIKMSLLLHSDTVVIKYKPLLGKMRSPQYTEYKRIEKKLKRKKKRVILESEIGFAIIYCSIEQYCNPLFKKEPSKIETKNLHFNNNSAKNVQIENNNKEEKNLQMFDYVKDEEFILPDKVPIDLLKDNLAREDLLDISDESSFTIKNEEKIDENSPSKKRIIQDSEDKISSKCIKLDEIKLEPTESNESNNGQNAVLSENELIEDNVPKKIRMKKIPESFSDFILDSSICLNNSSPNNKAHLEEIEDTNSSDSIISFHEKQKNNCMKTKIRRRKTLSFATKLEIIQRIEKGETLASVGRAFDLRTSTISTIMKGKNRILDYIKNSGSLDSCIVTKRRGVVIEQTERLLKIWIDDCIRKNQNLSVADIKNKARNIYYELKKQIGEGVNGSESFVASNGWFHRFKVRANIKHLKFTEDATCIDQEATSQFLKYFDYMIKEGDYSPCQIFNAFETSLFWKKMPAQTYIAIEERKAPGMKRSKNCITLLLGSNISGDFKLKPLLIYNAENPRALKTVAKSKLPVIWKSNKKAWMTTEIFQDWFQEYFIPEVKNYCQKNNLPFKALLLLDHAPYHPSNLNDLDPNVEVMFLPPNTTSMLHPIDETVISIFRRYYLKNTMIQAFEITEKKGDATFKEFWQDYNILHAIKNIEKSWNDIGKSTMNLCWRKICPEFTLVFNEFENPEQITAEIVELGQKLDLQMDAEDVEELINSYSGELSNEELIEITKVNKDNYNESLENVSAKSLKLLTEYLDQIDNALNQLQHYDWNEKRSAEVVAKVRSALSCYRIMSKKNRQTSINSSEEN